VSRLRVSGQGATDSLTEFIQALFVVAGITSLSCHNGFNRTSEQSCWGSTSSQRTNKSPSTQKPCNHFFSSNLIRNKPNKCSCDKCCDSSSCLCIQAKKNTSYG